MSGTAPPEPDFINAPDLADRLERAAAWRVRIDGDERLAESPDFLTWLADPLNQEAFGRVSATWTAFDEHRAAPQIVAIRRDALGRARSAAACRPTSARRAFAAAAAIVFILAMGVAAWSAFWAPTEYRTAVGERRFIALKDGSQISLDSATTVEVHYTKTQRQLRLARGRAKFDVAHDVSRPFIVTAGEDAVVAVGTSFDVERLDDQVVVTLIEGKVVVKAQETPDQSANAESQIALAAGQQLTLKRHAPPALSAANLATAGAWESGRLVLSNEPLGEAVQRINRYTDQPLAVDPAVASIKMSGVFNSGDVAAFVDAVTTYFPIEASVSVDNHILLQKRHDSAREK